MNIYFKSTVFHHRIDCQNALQHSLLMSSTCQVAIWKIGPGLVVFDVRIRGNQNNCGSSNWSTAGHKRKTETFVVFTKINLFLEVLAEVNKFSHLHAHYVAVLFICVCPFQNFNILCIFYPSLIWSRLRHQAKWKFPVHLILKWTSWNLWHFAFCTLEFWDGSRLLMPVTDVWVSVGKEDLVSMTVACLDLYFPRKREIMYLSQYSCP